MSLAITLQNCYNNTYKSTMKWGESMKIGICDDEKIVRDDILKRIQIYNAQYKIETFSEGKTLLEADCEFDLIFLDIEMEGMNGLEVATLLRERGYKGEIIFLTSHSEFMQEAFKVKAFRYLCKPIEKEQLEEALYRLEQQQSEESYITVVSEGNVLKLKVSEIVYIEACGDETIIFTSNLRTYYTGKTLKYWKEQLENGNFMQVHRSYIVAFAYIKAYCQTYVEILGYGKEIPISRRMRVEFKKRFLQYMKTHVRHM